MQCCNKNPARKCATALSSTYVHLNSCRVNSWLTLWHLRGLMLLICLVSVLFTLHLGHFSWSSACAFSPVLSTTLTILTPSSLSAPARQPSLSSLLSPFFFFPSLSFALLLHDIAVHPFPLLPISSHHEFNKESYVQMPSLGQLQPCDENTRAYNRDRWKGKCDQ